MKLEYRKFSDKAFVLFVAENDEESNLLDMLSTSENDLGKEKTEIELRASDNFQTHYMSIEVPTVNFRDDMEGRLSSDHPNGCELIWCKSTDTRLIRVVEPIEHFSSKICKTCFTVLDMRIEGEELPDSVTVEKKLNNFHKST